MLLIITLSRKRTISNYQFSYIDILEKIEVLQENKRPV
ncbi:hypothetical protein JCM19294_1501 [Nonlabens tegetincola]|uniref:Uncharacterized protein n=1 Tax=Nonlabens tegetincola TaxID=323273 RepID=A0A090Q380_9FLAO|nr:hypothetical protein JCM19294_1501 [Nonlabens tegetincola]